MKKIISYWKNISRTVKGRCMEREPLIFMDIEMENLKPKPKLGAGQYSAKIKFINIKIIRCRYVTLIYTIILPENLLASSRCPNAEMILDQC